MVQNRRNVGSDKPLFVAEPDDHGRTVADRDDLLWIVGRQQDDCEQPAQSLHRSQHRLLQAVVFPLGFDEMCHDFGIRFGDELVAASCSSRLSSR